jgi:hypothetical protein
MLIYHPAFDLYHTIYRLLLLVRNVKGDSIEIDKLRVWDFYFLFPLEVPKNVTFPNELRDLRRIFNYPANPYENITDSKRTLEKMKGYQLAALKCLASYGYIDHEQLEKKIVLKTNKQLPDNLIKAFENLSEKERNVIKLLTSPFNDMGLYGNNGFKFRTGLLDFKYD